MILITQFSTVTYVDKNESNIDISLDTMLPAAYLLIQNFILYLIFNELNSLKYHL